MPKTMDFYLPKSMENSLPLTPNYMEYNFTYAQGKFKLEKFKTFCMEAPNGFPYDSSDVKAFSKVSYAD